MIGERPAKQPSILEMSGGLGHRLVLSGGGVGIRYYLPVLLGHACSDPGARNGRMHLGWYWMRDDEKEVPATQCRCGALFFGGAYPFRPLLGTPEDVREALLIRVASIVSDIAPDRELRLVAAGPRLARWWIEAAVRGLDLAIYEWASTHA